MKSIFKFAVLGAIVLTSCTKDEIVNQSTNLADRLTHMLPRLQKQLLLQGLHLLPVQQWVFMPIIQRLQTGVEPI